MSEYLPLAGFAFYAALILLAGVLLERFVERRTPPRPGTPPDRPGRG